MTRKQFKQNLEQAIESYDGYISNEDLETLLDLNFDEDSSITGWTFSDFNTFAIDYITEGIRYACRYSDLKWEDDDEDYDDEDNGTEDTNDKEEETVIKWFTKIGVL